MNIPETPHFVVQEFLHPDVFKFVSRSDGLERWRWFVSPFMYNCAHLLRELAGPLTINTWHKGGRFVGRGFRPANYRPENGAVFSQHYLSRAIDVSSARFSPLGLQKIVLDNQEEFEAIGLTTMENTKFTKTWLHLDARPKIKGLHPESGFLIVNP